MAEFISETVILHEGRYIPAVAGNADYASLIASGANIVPWQEATPTPEQVLAAEREAMNPYYTAFRFAMKQTPATGYAHLLDRVTQTVAAAREQDPYSSLVIWADSVTQIVRTHNDMDNFATLFNLSPAELDDLCRLALQIEVGA